MDRQACERSNGQLRPAASPHAASRDGLQVTLEVRGLSCTRGERELFGSLSFTLGRGQVLHVRGINGSGKTTLLRIVCGLSAPDSGTRHWCHEDVHNDPERFWSELLYIGHKDGVSLELSPLENLQFYLRLSAAPRACSPQRALERLQLTPSQDESTRVLSAGQRRRIALARLLVTSASLWVLDEPLTALDDAGRKILGEMLVEHSEAGGSTILTSHQELELPSLDVKELELGG